MHSCRSDLLLATRFRKATRIAETRVVSAHTESQMEGIEKMTRLYFQKVILTLFVGIVALLLIGVWEIGAQEGALTTLSRCVIDASGHPIAGITVAIVPVQDGRGAWFPINVGLTQQRFISREV